VRRLFGGAGIYADGLMFAPVSGAVTCLTADEHSAAAFEREQLDPFSYATNTRACAGIRSYRRMPDRLYDDPDALAGWARDALAAAGRSGMGRSAKAGSRRKPRLRP
jgi:DNA transformation protein